MTTSVPLPAPPPAPARPSLSAFFAQRGDSSPPPRGNNEIARKVTADIQAALRRRSSGSARSRQRHLGPSEIGHPCDRQVAAKLAGLGDRSSSDPWPSIVGTSVHAWLAEELPADSPGRWTTEQRVAPLAGHEGTADLYDAELFLVGDHKVLGDTGLVKLRTQGPSTVYHIQLLLYALGFVRQGYRVDHIALIGYPRTGSSLDGMYTWSEPITAASIEILEQVKAGLVRRKAYAAEVMAGTRTLDSVPATPETCIFCPVKGICTDAN